MFVGFTLRFVVLPYALVRNDPLSGVFALRNAIVASDLFKVYGKLLSLVLEPPPLPSLDVRLSLLLGAVVFLAWSISADVDVSFRALGALWDVLLFVWDFVKDVMHVAVFVVDTFLPLYNWWVTLWSQLGEGTYKILAKCQARGIMNAVSNLGEAMVHLGDTLVVFVGDPKGPLDVYNVSLSLQDALFSQEVAFECACDGLSPVFLVLLDGVRSRYFGNVVNETVNVFVGFVQTIILSVPPFGEIPSFSRVFGPLKRALIYLGKFLDEGLDNILNRAFDGLTLLLDGVENAVTSGDADRSDLTLARIPIFSVLGYSAAGGVGLVDMLVHTIVHLCAEAPITYDPVGIHLLFMDAITAFETSLYLPLQVVTDILSVVALPKIFVAALLTGENPEFGDRFVAKSVSLSLGHAFRAGVGLPFAVLDMLYFVFRGEFTDLTFPQILQRMDGQFGKCESYVTLQCDFFRQIDLATYEAEMYWALSSFRMRALPQVVRVASRAANVLLRILFSIEDMVHGQFSHVPINCGYGYNKECTNECQFYYDPNDPTFLWSHWGERASRGGLYRRGALQQSDLRVVSHEFYLWRRVCLCNARVRPQHSRVVRASCFTKEGRCHVRTRIGCARRVLRFTVGRRPPTWCVTYSRVYRCWARRRATFSR